MLLAYICCLGACSGTSLFVTELQVLLMLSRYFTGYVLEMMVLVCSLPTYVVLAHAQAHPSLLLGCRFC